MNTARQKGFGMISIVVVLVDEVPAAEEEHTREAVKLCPSQALRLTD